MQKLYVFSLLLMLSLHCSERASNPDIIAEVSNSPQVSAKTVINFAHTLPNDPKVIIAQQPLPAYKSTDKQETYCCCCSEKTFDSYFNHFFNCVMCCCCCIYCEEETDF